MISGWKTLTGMIGYALCDLAVQLFPNYPAVGAVAQALKPVFLALGGVGLAHKIEKAAQ